MPKVKSSHQKGGRSLIRVVKKRARFPIRLFYFVHECQDAEQSVFFTQEGGFVVGDVEVFKQRVLEKDISTTWGCFVRMLHLYDFSVNKVEKRRLCITHPCFTEGGEFLPLMHTKRSKRMRGRHNTSIIVPSDCLDLLREVTEALCAAGRPVAKEARPPAVERMASPGYDPLVVPSYFSKTTGSV